MKNFSAVHLAIVTLMFAPSVHGQLIDDFSSGSAAPYTTTVLLDTDADAMGNVSNTSSLTFFGGEVQFETTAQDSIEQLAITRSDFTLNIGEELQLDVDSTVPDADRGDQDFGLYVGGSTPVAGIRADYLAVFQRDAGSDVHTALFNDDNLGGQTNGFGGDGVYETLFITRTGADTYEAGFISNGVRNILRDEVTIATDAAGPTIGLYADVRGVDVLESGYDNLRIAQVPEPGSLALLALGSIGLIGRRRRS